MKTILWLCFCALPVLQSGAQSDPDSIAAALSREPKHRIAEAASLAAFQFWQQGKLSHALRLYAIAERNLTDKSDAQLAANISNSMGAIYGILGKYDSCILAHKKAARLFLNKKDTANLVVSESNLAIVYKNIGLYEEAMESAFHTLQLLGTNTRSLAAGSCYNTIASVQTRTGNDAEAMKYYRLAAANRAFNRQLTDVAKIYNNIGELCITTQQYDSAKKYFMLAAQIKEEFHETTSLARTLTNLGRSMLLEGDIRAASDHLTRANQFVSYVDDPSGYVDFLIVMAELGAARQYYPDAAILLDSATRWTRLWSPDQTMRWHTLHIALAKDLRDYRTALSYSERLMGLKDSLNAEERNRTLQAMHIRFETQQKEQHIAALQSEQVLTSSRLKDTRVWLIIAGLGLLLSVVVAVSVYINLTIAQKARHRIQLLLAETRHRIKNNLQTLAGVFHLQSAYYKDANLATEASEAETRLHAMSLLHQELATGDDHPELDTSSYLHRLLERIRSSYGFDYREISFSYHVAPVTMEPETAATVGLILNELICNSSKYAFTGVSQPKLFVSIEQNSEGLIAITCRDNGTGFRAVERQHSFGMDLIHLFVEQLHGSLKILTDDGTTFIVHFLSQQSWKRD